MFAWFLAESGDVGKKPYDDEEVIFTHEKDLRTGQFFDVQVTKCKICGQVISWVRFNHLGQVVGGYHNIGHDCNKIWGKKNGYSGAGIMKSGNPIELLEHWQRRLSRR